MFRSLAGVAALVLATGTAAVLHAQQAPSLSLAPLTPEDYVAIQQLYARYSYGLDSANDDGSMFANLFTTDGILLDENGKATQGRASLAALARAYPGKSPSNVQHFIWNVRIDPAPGGGASGKAYVSVTKLAAAGQPAQLVAAGQYWDDLVKTAEGWRIRKREFKPGAVGAARGAAPPTPAR